ncbi:MAG: NAD-dependent DNA ligase LigA [Erysipelotrichaceae bacterium]|nr:NAD-dependent DNA ligase LigA [Erysipelotrichaceae bacterium]
MDKLEEMKQLAEQLNNAADAYYNGRGELMTDYEWDAMFDRLKQIEDETGIVLEESPTNRVSADQIAGQKEAHEFAALSLAKTKKPEDLVKWAEGRPIWISWKLDGLTLVATYDNGRLTKVVTRGDGHIGTNITHLAKAINGIPQTIPEQGHTVIRGEAVISYADFEAFNMESDEEYANPRNLASGSLTLKNVDEVKKRNINWIPFTLVYSETEMNSWGQRMQWLDDQGFRTVERRLIEHPDMGSVTEAIDLFTKQVTDRVNPYPVDGLVIAYDDTVYASTGSVTGHHATRAGYAFKWQDESAETVLDYIEWSCAASTITPVAVFAPVELEGTTVKRASLCNISECERLGIGESGTVLEVIKANKIIPKVIKVVKTEGVLNIPDVCPVCGASAEIYESPVSGTRTLRCTNPACTAKQLKKYTRFVSKQGMDIDGISEQTLARFINAGWIRSYGDVYRLPEHQTEIAEMDGFGEKSAQNLKDAVEKAKTVTDQKMLYALCIPLVGQDVAKRLLSAYPVNELISMAENAEQEDIFSSIDGIGPEKSASFVRWFKDADNAAVVRDLLSEITVKETERVEAGQLCQALTFVVTGDVYHYKNRNELKAYIESQGGKVTGSVSKSTSFLINNDIASTSGKNQKAIQLGIPIISEDEFIRRFTESGSEE